MIKIILLIIVIFILIITLYMNFHPAFGDTPNAESMQHIEKSEHFDGEHFQNLIKTRTRTIDNNKDNEKVSYWSLIKKLLFSAPEGKTPKELKTVKLEVKNLKNNDFVWLGHSSVLFKTNNTTIITDPVFYNAAPVPKVVEPFKMTNRPRIEDLPYIDVVVISHDHYDHLDYKAIKEINNKVGVFYVPLAVKAHLLRWGIANEKIKEFDWYEETTNKDIRFVFTPSRHFSGRGIFNHNTTLWGSWTILSPELKIYFSGDGGYSPEFQKIGERFGPFDIAFIEDGAYNQNWREVHMHPEQSAQASIDLKTKIVLPIHWAKFDLSTHKWDEPIKRFIKAINNYNETASTEEKIKVASPKIGELFSIDNIPSSKWWEDNI